MNKAIIDGNHAFIVGCVGGSVAKMIEDRDGMNAWSMSFETDIDGDYTNRFFLDVPSGHYIVTVEKESEKELKEGG